MLCGQISLFNILHNITFYFVVYLFFQFGTRAPYCLLNHQVPVPRLYLDGRNDLRPDFRQTLTNLINTQWLQSGPLNSSLHILAGQCNFLPGCLQIMCYVQFNRSHNCPQSLNNAPPYQMQSNQILIFRSSLRN